MYPFIHIWKLVIPVYGLCIVAGIISGGFIAKKLCLYQNTSFLDFIIISTLLLSFGFVSAKLLFILVTYPIKSFFSVLFSMLSGKNSQLLSSGLIFYGGIPGGILGYLLGVKIAKCKINDFLNVFAVIIPFAHGFGRIGCFFAGCCYGKFFPAIGIVFPVQLLEAFVLFLISLFLFIQFKKNHSSLLLNYLLFYSVARFFLEFLRGDSIRGFKWIFSTSQWISIFVFIFSIICCCFVKKRENCREEI